MKNWLVFVFASTLFFSCTKSVKNYHDNGKLKEEYQINEEGEKNGIYKRYFEDGTLAEESHFINEIEDGERILYFQNGNIETKIPYKNGKVQGKKTVYYDTGELLIEAEYINNKIEGVFKKYYKNGKVLEEVTFVNDLENGPFIEFYESGIIKWKGQYLNGDNEFGIIENYNETGDLIKKLECDSSKICRTIWTLEKSETNE